jgi:predicted nucleotidyltransferase
MTEPRTELKGKAAEIARVLREHLLELEERYGVSSLGIFGSYVRGEERDESDVDILVEFGRSTDLFEFGALEQRLSELVGRKVDLVMKRALKRHIGKRILREVVSL